MGQHSIRKGMKKASSDVWARLWSRPSLTPAQVLAAAPARILVVSPHSQMGDLLCTTPVLRMIRETWPRSEITLICAPLSRDVVLHNPHIDRLAVFDKRACRWPAPLWSFLRGLRRWRPDMAVVPDSRSFSVTGVTLALASGAPIIVGGDSAPFGFDISRHVYSLTLPATSALDRHAVDHNLAPFEAVGFTVSDRRPVLVTAPDQAAKAREIVREVPGTGAPWILHPGAGKAANRWPAARFADLAVRAVREGRRVLVLSGPYDAGPVAEFNAAARRSLRAEAPPIPVVTCTAQLAAALLAGADRFLCNDTGLMHVAGAVGAPTLALFGPTEPAYWIPRTPESHVLRGEGGHIEALDADTVWDRWRALPTRSAVSRE